MPTCSDTAECSVCGATATVPASVVTEDKEANCERPYRTQHTATIAKADSLDGKKHVDDSKWEEKQKPVTNGTKTATVYRLISGTTVTTGNKYLIVNANTELNPYYELTLTLKHPQDYVWNIDGVINDVDASIKVRMVINPLPITSDVINIAAIPNEYYTGSQIKPEMDITYGSTELVAGVDYTVVYGVNTAVGTGTAKVVGINNFSGEKSFVFNIIEQRLDMDVYAQFNPTYYRLTSATGVTKITPCDRPTYDNKIYAVKLDLTSKMYVSDFIGMLSETQQEAVKVFYTNGTLMQKSEYSKVVLTTGIRIMLVDNDKITDDLYIAIKGDINGDGAVNVADLTILKKYLRGAAGIVGIYSVAADINGDGAVNTTDVSLFKSWQ